MIVFVNRIDGEQSFILKHSVDANGTGNNLVRFDMKTMFGDDDDDDAPFQNYPIPLNNTKYLMFYILNNLLCYKRRMVPGAIGARPSSVTYQSVRHKTPFPIQLRSHFLTRWFQQPIFNKLTVKCH